MLTLGVDQWHCEISANKFLSEDPTTKIVVFCDGRIVAGLAAADALKCIGCTFLARDDTVQQKNKKIAWYQHADTSYTLHRVCL
jgi:hypothetical protein